MKDCQSQWNVSAVTFYNSTCMTYQDFCTNFQLLPTRNETCYNETAGSITNFEDLYSRYELRTDKSIFA